MDSNHRLTEVGTNSHDQNIKAIAQCLKDYLSVHGRNAQHYQVLQFLADATLERLSEGKQPRFNYLAIRDAVTGDTGGDASAWFGRHWKTLMGDFRQKCEEGVQKFAADQGLMVYPWIEKRESSGGAGNQALISLVALPIPGTSSPVAKALPKHDIDYIPAEKLKLSWWIRWVFDKDQVAKGWRKWMLVWPNLLWFAIVGIVTAFLLWAMGQSAAPLTTRDAIFLIYIGLLAWYARYLIDRLFRLVDDRIILASDSMVGFKEFGVCLELFKPEGSNADTPKRARMIKYAGTCPVCSAQVLLDKGEPDFPRRIVGRCQDSPREHVFSFDRATQTGYRLR